MGWRSLLAVVAASVAVTVAPAASAQETSAYLAPAAHETEWEMAAKASLLTPPVRGGTTPFGAGFGGRIGVTLADVYVGISAVDYLGATDVDTWSHGVLYGAEAGYGFRSRTRGGISFILRPQLGAGGVTIFRTEPSAASAATSTKARTRAVVDVITTASGGTSGSGSSGSASATTTTSVSNVYLQPGLTLLLRSETVFAGANVSALVIPGLTYGENDATTWVSYGFEGQLGLRF
jgi:hypothetical protein